MDFIPLLSAIIGVISAYIFQQYSESKRKKDEGKALRKLLRIEIKNNEYNLYKFHNNMKSNSSSSFDEECLIIDLAKQELINVKNSLWIDKTVLFAEALNEYEINRIESFYDLFEDCIKIQKEAMKLKKEEDRRNRAPFKINIKEFDDSSKENKVKLYQKYFNTYVKILEEGRSIYKDLQ